MLSGAKSEDPCRFLFSHLINQQWVAPAIASLHYSVFVLWQKAVALIRRDDLFSIMRIDGFSSAPPNIFSLSLTLSTEALILSYPPHTLQRCVEKRSKWSTMWLMDFISSRFDFPVTAHLSFVIIRFEPVSKSPFTEERLSLSSPDHPHSFYLSFS